MKEQDIELINKFLDNELREEEVKLFKDKYENDPEFKKEVNIRSKIYISLDAASRVSKKIAKEKPLLWRFLQTSSEVHQKGAIRNNLQTFYRYAAIVIPLIALGIVLVLTIKPKPGTGDLYASYFKAPPEEVSKGNEQPPDFSGMLKQIDQAATTRIDSLKSESEQDCFTFGIFCMEKQRFTEAIYAFSLLLNSRIEDIRTGSQWFLGLCYLRTSEMEKAKGLFRGIKAEDGHPYQQESAKLLSKLE